jgi:hypothetical protein
VDVFRSPPPNLATQEDVNYTENHGYELPPDYADRVLKPAVDYCSKKYLNLPHISGITNKNL